MALDPTTLKLATALGILVGGYIVARIGSSLIISFSKKKETISINHIRLVKVFRYIVMIFY